MAEREEIDALRREASAGEDAPQVEAAIVSPGDGAVLRAGKLKALSTMVATVGNGFCRRRNVAILDDGEVADLSEAVLCVMDVFNFETDPRIQALGLLAFTIVGVVDKRLPMVNVTPPQADAASAG